MFTVLTILFFLVGNITGLPTDYCAQRLVGKFCRKEFSGNKSVLCFDTIFVNREPCFESKCPNLSLCKKILFSVVKIQIRMSILVNTSLANFLNPAAFKISDN